MIVLTPRQQAAIKRHMGGDNQICKWHCRKHGQVIMGVYPHAGDHVCNRRKGHALPCRCWRCGEEFPREATQQDTDRAQAMWDAYEAREIEKRPSGD